ncbi:MAG: hypothetical protein JJE25_04160 [Bacteroidia bacterium]|nr:hypothetical protein [Bacteroidia bacterium]
MQYHNHELRSNLQEWKNRLYKTKYDQFHNQLNYFINNIEKEKILITLLNEGVLKYPLKEDFETVITNLMHGSEYGFKDEENEATFCFLLIKNLMSRSENKSSSQILSYHFLQGQDMEDRKVNLIEGYIQPIINYLHDKLDKSNSTIFLLEKYKRRIEWFCAVRCSFHLTVKNIKQKASGQKKS